MAVEFRKIGKKESWDIFDKAAKRLLMIDGATFASQWDRGDYAATTDSKAVKVAMLRPSGR